MSNSNTPRGQFRTGMPGNAARRERVPGTVLKRLPAFHGERSEDAQRRASVEPWWPRVTSRFPVLSCGVWCWQVHP